MRSTLRYAMHALVLLAAAATASAQTGSAPQKDAKKGTGAAPSTASKAAPGTTPNVPHADSAHPGRAALIYGDRHALTIHAPDKWTLDTKSGLRQGLQAVFYPDGERWSKSPAVMYCQVVGRGKEIADMRAMLEYDLNRYRNSGPTALVEDDGTISIGGGRKAVVRRFSGGPKGTFERVAYIEERTVIVMIVLSCRTVDMFDTSLAAFKQLVGSYHFLADDQENILRALEAAGR